MPETPFCRHSVDHESSANDDSSLSNKLPSACLVRDGRYLLVVEHRLSGRYDLPAGQASNEEFAACTAHRETFEETGLNVEVVQFVGQSSTGLQLFHCKQQAGFSAPEFAPPAPFWQTHEIADVLWIDPFEISEQDWRFPEQLVEVRADAATIGQDSDTWSLRFPRFKTFRGFELGEKI